MSIENQSNPEDHTDPVRWDIWYDDGNIVLQARNAQFKVHKSILAHSSSVFKDMFSFPQPPSQDTHTVEGCPVVHLSNSAEDVRYMLQALFQREYVADGEKIPFAVVSAFLSPGGKYDIPKLRAEAIKKLYREFPTTLEDMDTVADAWVTIDLRVMTSEYMELAMLARNNRVDSILPYLLYQCCKRYSVSEILQGLVRKDGSPILLSAEDQLACLTGHRRICGFQAETTFGWAYAEDFASAICGSSKCHHTRQRFLFAADLTPVPKIQGLVCWEGSSYATGLCEACAMKAKERHKTGRKAFWDEIPGYFCLPSWNELQKQREDSGELLVS